MEIQKNPYFEFQGLFCKVIISRLDNRTGEKEEKPLKGILECVSEELVSIKGDYQMTTVNIKDITRVATKPPR